jgi:hypothetical protein
MSERIPEMKNAIVIQIIFEGNLSTMPRHEQEKVAQGALDHAETLRKDKGLPKGHNLTRWSTEDERYKTLFYIVDINSRTGIVHVTNSKEDHDALYSRLDQRGEWSSHKVTFNGTTYYSVDRDIAEAANAIFDVYCQTGEGQYDEIVQYVDWRTEYWKQKLEASEVTQDELSVNKTVVGIGCLLGEAIRRKYPTLVWVKNEEDEGVYCLADLSLGLLINPFNSIARRIFDGGENAAERMEKLQKLIENPPSREAA